MCQTHFPFFQKTEQFISSCSKRKYTRFLIERTLLQTAFGLTFPWTPKHWQWEDVVKILLHRYLHRGNCEIVDIESRDRLDAGKPCSDNRTKLNSNKLWSAHVLLAGDLRHAGFASWGHKPSL
jgi:hypothetical protein